jgi:hypothetical protein
MADGQHGVCGLPAQKLVNKVFGVETETVLILCHSIMVQLAVGTVLMFDPAFCRNVRVCVRFLRDREGKIVFFLYTANLECNVAA